MPFSSWVSLVHAKLMRIHLSTCLPHGEPLPPELILVTFFLVKVYSPLGSSLE
jgi:hypothetical protein